YRTAHTRTTIMSSRFTVGDAIAGQLYYPLVAFRPSPFAYLQNGEDQPSTITGRDKKQRAKGSRLRANSQEGKAKSAPLQGLDCGKTNAHHKVTTACDLSTMSRATKIRDPKALPGGGGRGPDDIWPGGWGGGGGRGGGDDQPSYSERLRRLR